MRSSIFLGVLVALTLLLTAALAYVVIDHDAGVSQNDNDISLGNAYTSPAPLTVMKTGDLMIITSNKGSSSATALTLYRPGIVSEGWYLVGDVAEASYGAPTHQAILVSSSDPTAFAVPVDWELAYSDRGTTATMDMTIWNPVAPEGYVGLGSVAVKGYGKPFLSKYRCVNKSYCVAGTLYNRIWDDKLSKADMDGSAWSITPAVAGGIDASTFWTVPSHSKPSAKVYCLNGDYVSLKN